ncbi:sensor histidine kinase [Paenibacillus luteus]|uniref:sensor histidine kinase n=1 Tax=Paenibacillus luteus TaxID=2545753 RepID=UPI00114389AB|nr:histidine kinase [Paenibacillus luteus]
MSKKERSLFSKLVGSLVLLLLPVLILSVYSNRVNEDVITGQLKQSNISRLSTLGTQMNHIIMQMETFSHMLLRDPNVVEFQDLSLLNTSHYEQIKKKKIILDKLNLQAASTNWINDITVYSPQSKQSLSTMHGTMFNPERLRKLSEENWNFIWNRSGVGELGKVIHLTFEQFEGGITNANAIIEIGFDMSNVIRMLDEFKAQGNGEVLFYRSREAYLTASSMPPLLLEQGLSALQSISLANEGDLTLKLNGTSYLLTYSDVQALDGYVVHIVPLDEILTPLRVTNQFSYLVLGLLLIVGIVVSWLLYRNVQVPLGALVKGVQQIKMGQYKSRIPLRVNNEFRLVISRFNEMAEQVQQLIENVLEQKLYAREAELKQLQSQINPHFLYNSLTYVVSMTKLGNKDAVINMAYHLSDYYRYTTRVENQLVKLSEELKNADDYLSIHRMRMKRIKYSIQVMPELLEVTVPRLILQPIIENALIHGIEGMEGDGVITITGNLSGSMNVLIVEDNGGAMTTEKVMALQRMLNGSPDDRTESCGLRNVHRRLRLRYEADSGVRLSCNAAGGLRAELRWREGGE